MTDGSRPGWTGGFTHRPSVLGWVMLLIPGAVIGGLIATAFGSYQLPGALVGSMLVWRIALYLDWKKANRLGSGEHITFEIDVANVAELDQITARLREQGIRTTGEEKQDDEGRSRFYLTARVEDRDAVEADIGWA